MKQNFFVFLFLCLCFPLSSFAQTGETETLRIITYYPSPYGVYKNLRLYPSSEPTANVSAGAMYYDNDTGVLRYYNNNGEWVDVTGSSNCVLVAYDSTPPAEQCPAGYYTWSGMEAQPTGQMLCCQVKSTP